MGDQDFNPLYIGDTPEAERREQRVLIGAYLAGIALITTPIALVTYKAVELFSQPGLGINGTAICESIVKAAQYCAQ